MRKNCLTIITVLFFLSSHAQHWDRVGVSGLNYYQGGGGVNYFSKDSVNDLLYVFGNLSSSDGIPINNSAKWNGVQWDSIPRSTNNFIGNIYNFNNHLYACGAHVVYSWSGWDWDTIAKFPYGGANGLTAYNNQLYAVGSFDTISGVEASWIAKWDGSTWSALDTTKWFGNSFGRCVVFNGDLIVSGIGWNNYHQSLQGIVRWDGTSWQPLGSGIAGGAPYSVALYHNELYAGGNFLISQGNAGDFIQKWDGNSWSDVGGGSQGLNRFNGQISDMVVYHGELYVVGSFTEAGGIPAEYIAKWDGTNWCGLGSVFDRPISSVAVYHDTLFIGSGFYMVDGDSIRFVAKWTGGSFVDTCGSLTGFYIHSAKAESEISVYPNPTTGKFSIKSSEIIEAAEIYNVLGEKVFESLNPVSEIDLSKHPDGVYFLRIRSKEKIFTKKILKQ